MQQDTDGKVQYLRKTALNTPDGGIDGETTYPDDYDYQGYVRSLLDNKNADEE